MAKEKSIVSSKASSASLRHVEAVSTVDVSDLQGLSLYQRKCVLINREIDAYGMGRSQWCVWALCGCGHFIDLLWAQASGLVLSPLQQELGFGDGQSGNIATSFNAGLTAGAFFWGLMADIIGHRWAFNLTCLVSSVFGLCLGASKHYTMFLILTAFVGFGVGGNIPVDSAIFLEFAPRNRRFLLACLLLFQPLGVIVSSAIAFGFIPTYSCSPNFSQPNPLPSCRGLAEDTKCCSRKSNMGWRYVLFTTGTLSLAVFILRFLVFTFRETPKYLIHCGRDEEAIEAMRHITGGKDSTCSITSELFKSVERDYEIKI